MQATELPAALAAATRVVVFTGAGVSAESGIPTFRDALSGLWERFDPAALATAEAFRRDPALVWGWYEWRRMQVAKAQPNPAHQAIAELARHLPQLTLITQNVDDLHERAGSREVIHLHGSLHRPRCFDCAREPAEPLPVPDEPEGGRRLEPPRCGRAWSGSARACQMLLCAPPSPPHKTATCCSRSAPPEWSIPPPRCHIGRATPAPRWCISTRRVTRRRGAANTCSRCPPARHCRSCSARPSEAKGSMQIAPKQ